MLNPESPTQRRPTALWTSAGQDVNPVSLRGPGTSLAPRTGLEQLAMLLGRDVISSPGTEAAYREALNFLVSPEYAAMLLSLDLPRTSAPTPSLSFQELAQVAATRWSLSKTDLAKVLRVSRPTLYSWLSGGEPDNPRAQEGLRLLGTIPDEISPRAVRPLYRRFVYEPMPGESLSIIQLLETETWEAPLLRRLFRKASELTSERDHRLGSHPPLAPEVQEANLLDNLLSLGGE